MDKALAGVRVVDLTQFEAGPSCTEMLAWMGPDVIKVQAPTRGDQGRRLGGEKPGEDSWDFLSLNANTRSVTLTPTTPQGLDICKQPLRHAGIVVENDAPGATDIPGLGY